MEDPVNPTPDNGDSNPPDRPQKNTGKGKPRKRKSSDDGIKLIKLVSGELLVAECKKLSKSNYLLVHPFIVIPIPLPPEEMSDDSEDLGDGTFEYDISYRTWIFGSNQITFEVSSERIVLIAEPEARTVKDYLFMTELSNNSKKENIEENLSDEIIDKIKNAAKDYKNNPKNFNDQNNLPPVGASEDISDVSGMSQESFSIDDEYDKRDTSPWSHTRRFNIFEDLD